AIVKRNLFFLGDVVVLRQAGKGVFLDLQVEILGSKSSQSNLLSRAPSEAPRLEPPAPWNEPPPSSALSLVASPPSPAHDFGHPSIGAENPRGDGGGPPPPTATPLTVDQAQRAQSSTALLRFEGQRHIARSLLSPLGRVPPSVLRSRSRGR
ncbi:hypothetical protein GW17_00052173, partial [Ensete ventricosum]